MSKVTVTLNLTEEQARALLGIAEGEANWHWQERAQTMADHQWKAFVGPVESQEWIDKLTLGGTVCELLVHAIEEAL